MTILSLKGVVRYLLSKGLKYVLSEKFCQDDVENYFGRQRPIGRRKNNPNVKDTGYADNTIKSQFSVQPVGGKSFRVRRNGIQWMMQHYQKEKSEFLTKSYYLLSIYFVYLLY